MAHTALRTLIATGLVAVTATTSLTACSTSGSKGDKVDATPASSSHQVTLKLGTTDPSATVWPVFKKEAKKKNIIVDVVPFTDYTTPNKALSEKKLDVNKFQHIKFLAEYNVGTGDNLVPVGATEIFPLALFWKGHKDLNGIEGKSVAIPNDSTNQGRAINVLVQAGLIKLKKKGIVTPTPADVDQAASKVKLTPVEATQTTAAYGQGDPAIINNNFLGRAGISPSEKIFSDDPASPQAAPYINAFVTRPEDANNPNILELVKIWHLPDVQKAVAADTKSTSVPVTRSGKDLQTLLKKLEDAKRAEGKS